MPRARPPAPPIDSARLCVCEDAPRRRVGAAQRVTGLRRLMSTPAAASPTAQSIATGPYRVRSCRFRTNRRRQQPLHCGYVPRSAAPATIPTELSPSPLPNARFHHGPRPAMSPTRESWRQANLGETEDSQQSRERGSLRGRRRVSGAALWLVQAASPAMPRRCPPTTRPVRRE